MEFEWIRTAERKPDVGLEIILVSDGFDVSTGFYTETRGFTLDSCATIEPVYWCKIHFPEDCNGNSN